MVSSQTAKVTKSGWEGIAMSLHSCPHCKEKSFSNWDKFLAGKWKVLSCPRCGARACSTPLLLAFYYLFYLMVAINFSYLAYLYDALIWGAVAVAVWLVLDYVSLYLPLSPMGNARSSHKVKTKPMVS